MKRLSLFIAVCCFSFAQVFAQEALIVKQEGARVYLDISEFKEKPQVNDAFTVTFWGGELKNPKTGKVLGKTIERRLNGTVTEVETLFAVGNIKDFNKQDKLEGLNADIKVSAPVQITTNAQNPNTVNMQTLWQSKPLDGKALAFTAGDISGNGQSDLILADEDNNIVTYNLQDGKLNKVAGFKFSPLHKIVSLDNADLNGNNKTELFISYFDTAKNRFNTAVYEFENNNFAEKAIISGLVKGIAPYNAKRVLYTQNITSALGKSKTSKPALLVYKDGKYQAGANLKAYKFHSIYGFNLGKFEGEKEHVIYTQPSGKLRLQFDKSSSFINSPSEFDFASTPTRVKFDNEILKFYSSLALYDKDGSLIIAGLENEAKLGILSSTFGSYQRAKLLLLKWDGSSIESYGEASLGGYTVDLLQGSLGDYKDVLIVPFINGAGKTTVALYPAK